MHTTAATPTPTVSWLLCTNVADRWLDEAVRSCLAQDYDDFELLLVANGDDADGVASRLERYRDADPRVVVLKTSLRHLPFSLSWGAHMARGRYLARMDADDVSQPGRLRAQVEFLDTHPDVAVVGTWYATIDSDGRVQRVVELPTSDAAIRQALLWGNPICHPSAMIRRDSLARLGGYLGGLSAEDYDLWCRVAVQSGLRLANLPDPLLHYRINPSGASRRSRAGYAAVAASQLRTWLATGRARWLAAAAVTTVKTWARANKP